MVRGKRADPKTSFDREVIRVIRGLKPGEVASYGEIAEEAGFPRSARAVGSLLSRTDGLPWWRVVRADGRLVSPNEEKQGRLLMKEGVVVVEGRVVDPPSLPKVTRRRARRGGSRGS